MKDWTFRVTASAYDVNLGMTHMLSGYFDTGTGTVHLFHDSPNGVKTPVSPITPFTWSKDDRLSIHGAWT